MTANCPICENSKITRLQELSSEQAASYFSLSQGGGSRHQLRPIIEDLWQGSSCSVERCESCGFVFSSPFRAGSQRFYEVAFPDQTQDSYPSFKWEFHEGLNQILRLRLSSPRVLEIGCGKGAFLSILKSTFRAAYLVGLEYSQFGVQSTRGVGLPCFRKDVYSYFEDNDPAKFDVIAMFQVLEHLDSVVDLFGLLRSRLSSGGILIIGVPNDLRGEFNRVNGAMRDMPPFHIGRYSKESLGVLASKAGLYLSYHMREPSADFRNELYMLLMARFHSFRVNSRHKSSVRFWDANPSTRKARMMLDLFAHPFLYARLLFSAKRLGGGCQLAVFTLKEDA